MARSEDILAEAREAFEECQEAEKENRELALDDLKFARLGEQWPDAVVKQRLLEGRPCLTINRLPAFIRQVVNDARQNKPSIKVHPVDSAADVETAEIYNGLIRHIEYSSPADVAYDTATENAVSMGWGYFGIDFDYAHGDTFDLDLRITRKRNPFAIYGDPDSEAADSADWNVAFEVDRIRRKTFERQYKGAEATDWEADLRAIDGEDWLNDDGVLLARWWTREEVEKHLLLIRTPMGELVIDEVRLRNSPEIMAALEAGEAEVIRSRPVKTWKVRRRLMTGAEILADEEWPGQYIPIVPVYGEEIDVEGRRVLRSLIRDAKDSQRNHNYWRTTATELVALAPRVPFIGPKGAFTTDADKWATANTVSHPYIEYDGPSPPQRQPLDTGSAAGALQEALLASDDMKAIIGLYDASLGARSNETSGRAILARQREGDVSTFHFQDNMTRAIRHAGRILIDLIPTVYNTPRMLRIIGEDGKTSEAAIRQPVPVMGPDGQPRVDETTGKPMMRVFDLGAGKYDLTVTTGPTFTTRREEAAYSMTEALRAYPAGAPVIVPELAKNLDWPGADDIAEKLEALAPKPPGEGIPPEMQRQIQQGLEELRATKAENEQLKADRALEMAKLQAQQAQQDADAMLQMKKLELEARKMSLEERKIAVQEYEAQTARMGAMRQPEPWRPVVA